MNIVLFEEGEIEAGYLPNNDDRVEHVKKVLRRDVGESFDAGQIHGKRGKATVLEYGSVSMSLRFDLEIEEPKLLPIDLVVGLSRPQTMRKILNEATSLGVRSIRFVVTERGEPSYAQSRLWTTGEWRRHALAGAAQAFTTRLPVVSWGMPLEEALGAFGCSDERLLALDNYEAMTRLGLAVGDCEAIALAVGSERGWTGPERQLLRERGWQLVDMGKRVLRTETAVVAAVGVARELMELPLG
ncbi:RsmE family RNA methyltransferase [Pelagicoccus sp. SDUM812003]|uniref:16S rRNA (uracil(1498)-N(3))-methyltransferase n=1 Tax=Pelagicoccus sp. SDUM812003 TaxID=3041267 RepID=UPI00280C5E0D|nr:RsmE family RNA methyltransferase [Pelagicoccus sp. SDUM812003]MDQ8202280.1 RsmE family RNA methyltransferase [Pelagicoccus sp. SDUM812003]